MDQRTYNILFICTGGAERILGLFRDALLVLKRRIELFTSLPLASIDRISLQRELQQTGQK